MTEIEIVIKMNAMCVESCNPENFEAWKKIVLHLSETRKALSTLCAYPEMAEHPCEPKINAGKCDELCGKCEVYIKPD